MVLVQAGVGHPQREGGRERRRERGKERGRERREGGRERENTENTEGTDTESYRCPSADFTIARVLEAVVNDLIPYHLNQVIAFYYLQTAKGQMATGREKMGVTM